MQYFKKWKFDKCIFPRYKSYNQPNNQHQSSCKLHRYLKLWILQKIIQINYGTEETLQKSSNNLQQEGACSQNRHRYVGREYLGE